MNEQTKAQVEAYAEECRTEQLELLRTLGKMPAPTRKEDFRAAFCRDWLRAQGAENVRIDSAKNVICKLGPDTEELVVFAAHTDIVFPDVENLPLREEGGKLFAPGIGDDTANLVNLLMAAKYLIQKQTALEYGVLVVANACEKVWAIWTVPRHCLPSTAPVFRGSILLISICRFAAAVPWVLIGIRSPVKRPVVTPMQILATPVPFNCCVDS